LACLICETLDGMLKKGINAGFSNHHMRLIIFGNFEKEWEF
jgi:hypothetical protein